MFLGPDEFICPVYKFPQKLTGSPSNWFSPHCKNAPN